MWLHAAGMDSMATRYPLSVGIAYLVFLLELSFYVSRHRAARRNLVDDSVIWHAADLSGIQQDAPTRGGMSTTSLSEKPSGGGFDFGGIDADGIMVVLMIVAAIIVSMMASLSAIYQAPVLLAEVLVDGVLFFGIARRVNRMSAQHWVSGVIRRTLGPILLSQSVIQSLGLACNPSPRRQHRWPKRTVRHVNDKT